MPKHDAIHGAERVLEISRHEVDPILNPLSPAYDAFGWLGACVRHFASIIPPPDSFLSDDSNLIVMWKRDYDNMKHEIGVGRAAVRQLLEKVKDLNG